MGRNAADRSGTLAPVAKFLPHGFSPLWPGCFWVVLALGRGGMGNSKCDPHLYT